MPQRRRSNSCCCCGQYPSGLLPVHATGPTHLEPPNSSPTEGGIVWHLWSGSTVSVPPPATSGHVRHVRLWLIRTRTCICGVMRAYYATYVYYYTYDITWYAWYGWIWTTLEAQLGLICACGPAMKGFAKRYFSMSTIRSDAYGYASKQHSNSRRIPGYGRLSAGNSLATSSLDSSKWGHEPLPMGAIKVSTTTKVAEDRDETASQNSASSTRNLKALPIQPLPLVHRDARRSDPFHIWNSNRTVVTAYSQDQDIDVEKHARTT